MAGVVIDAPVPTQRFELLVAEASRTLRERDVSLRDSRNDEGIDGEPGIVAAAA